MNASQDTTRDTVPGPEEGGGPPVLSPWTLVVAGDDGRDGWSADLDHGAPLPRIGEQVVYIAEDGAQRRFRVRDIVHTVQVSAAERPRVRDGDSTPNATVNEPHVEHLPHGLRAGLPRVLVSPES